MQKRNDNLGYFIISKSIFENQIKTIFHKQFIKKKNQFLELIPLLLTTLKFHFHNFRTMDIGDRLWLQCPTTDPGSEWFRDRSGMESKPGLLTMVFGGDYDPRENISVIPVRL